MLLWHGIKRGVHSTRFQLTKLFTRTSVGTDTIVLTGSTIGQGQGNNPLVFFSATMVVNFGRDRKTILVGQTLLWVGTKQVGVYHYGTRTFIGQLFALGTGGSYLSSIYGVGLFTYTRQLTRFVGPSRTEDLYHLFYPDHGLPFHFTVRGRVLMTLHGNITDFGLFVTWGVGSIFLIIGGGLFRLFDTFFARGRPSLGLFV